MGNKLSASPFLSLDAAIALYSAGELNEIKSKFYKKRYVVFARLNLPRSRFMLYN
jgi:hypothetical protein